MYPSSRSVTGRVRVPELMDDPSLDRPRHAAALAGLARLNTASASPQSVWSPIERLARELSANRLRVLDVATGGGDIPCALWRIARRRGLHLDLHGIDISHQALDFARRRARACGAPIQFAHRDAIAGELPAGFDVIVSSLFLHHLEREHAAGLLLKMARAARHLVLVNDLRRCRTGLLLAHLAGRLLTRSPVVRVDAPRSVRAAFTLDEVRELARSVRLEGAVVRPRWPCRWLLQWRRS